MGKKNRKTTTSDKFFDWFDLYGSKVYQSNFEGRKNLNSGAGVGCSCFVYCFMLMYILLLATRLVYGLSPVVSAVDRIDVHTTEVEAIDLDQNKFFFAFNVRDYLTDEYKESTKYVNWSVKVIEGDGNKSIVTHTIKTRTCTPADWKKFYTPSKKDQKKFDILQERNVMRCLEDLDD